MSGMRGRKRVETFVRIAFFYNFVMDGNMESFLQLPFCFFFVLSYLLAGWHHTSDIFMFCFISIWDKKKEKD